MEKCSKCNRHVSLPFYVVLKGKLNVLCFTCACSSAGLTLPKTDSYDHAPFVTG